MLQILDIAVFEGDEVGRMRNTDKPLSVACAGAGYFSQFHYDAWNRIPNVEIVGAFDRTVQQAETTGHLGFDSLPKMLEECRPDILDIITPPETHLHFIKIAARHRVKTVICQKAFCKNIEEAREAVQIAADADMALVVHENFRFQPWFRLIKAEIDSGKIGDLLQLTFRMRTGDGQGADAYMERQPYFQKMERFFVHETGVHWLDTFRYLLGEPTHIYADLRQINPHLAGEDAGYIILDFEKGKRAILDANRNLDHRSANTRLTFGECLVEGTEGTLSLDGLGQVWHRNFLHQEETLLLPQQDWPGFAGDCVFALQSHVVKALCDGSPTENLAKEYIRVIELELAAYEAAKQNRKLEV